MEPLFRKARWLCIMILVIFCAGGLIPTRAAFGANARQPQQDFREFFNTVIPQQMVNEHVAGAMVAVVKNGEVAFAQGYGYANLETKVPVQADQTLFFIGSDGKLFTWTAVMQLVGQGKLDLHADVNQYLDFTIPAVFDEPITLHHLMTHTAGFEDDATSLLLDDPENILPLREHLVRFMPERVFPPGKVSAYSNYGTALAGYIVERVSGQSFETYLSEQLLKPLGMQHSFIGNTLPAEFASNLSMGYKYENGSYVPLDFEWTSAVPCAPVRATALDLTRFMVAHLNDGCVDGGCILPAEMIDLMHQSQFAHHPQMRSMAYGFLDMEINGQRVLWHMGESARFVTLFALIPDQNLGLLVSYNTPPVEGDDILFRFMDTFFPVTRPALNPQTLPGWDERAAQFSGTYVPARSAFTSPQILIRTLSAAPVTMGAGNLFFAGWTFVETEPGFFQQVDGDRQLSLQQDADGKRWLFVGPLAFFQVPWYQTPGFLFGLLGFSLLVFLSAWVAGLIAAFRRKKHTLLERAAWWLAGGLGLYNLGLLVWLVTVLLYLEDRYVYHSETVQIIAGLSWLAVPWTLLILALAGYAWFRRQWKLGGRIHYALVALTSAAFLWLLWSINLLGGRV